MIAAKRVHIGLVLVGGLIIGLLTGPAIGQPAPQMGSFFAELGGDPQSWNDLNADVSGGDGAVVDGVGPWIPYPNQPDTLVDPLGNQETGPNANTWWNEWWYNHPFDPNRWKWIDLFLTYELVDPAIPGFVVIVVNWSTPDWSLDPPSGIDPSSQPPLFDGLVGGPTWIERLELARLFIEDGVTVPIEWDWPGFVGTADPNRLPVPYNPEWVSVDIRGYNIRIIDGKLWHDCVPEPHTLGFLLIGALGLLLRCRRATPR